MILKSENIKYRLAEIIKQLHRRILIYCDVHEMELSCSLAMTAMYQYRFIRNLFFEFDYYYHPRHKYFRDYLIPNQQGY